MAGSVSMNTIQQQRVEIVEILTGLHCRAHFSE